MPPDVPVLRLRDLEVRFGRGDAEMLAVCCVSLEIGKGECFGLVGESGCGKSTIALAIMRYLARGGRISSGSIEFLGEDIMRMDAGRLRHVRGNRIALIGQDPGTSLNPAKRIGGQLVEVLTTHFGTPRRKALDEAQAMLASVSLSKPDQIMRRYPHQLSGGQKQRIMIAMAFLAKPDLLLLDEPTTALDPTVEKLVVDLLARLRREYGTSALFISHSLGLVRQLCDRVAIMYRGEIVEEAAAKELFGRPGHPYTRALLDCMPDMLSGKATGALATIAGEMRPQHARHESCSFIDRCAFAVQSSCGTGSVPLLPLGAQPDHRVRCVRVGEFSGTDRVQRAGMAVSIGDDVVLEVSGVWKRYAALGAAGFVANRDISFTVRRGETLAIVGESGSGKTTLARAIIGLDMPSEGTIRFRSVDIAGLPIERRPRPLLRAIQMIFQNPDSTLNPSRSVRSILERTVSRLGSPVSGAARRDWAKSLLSLVRLPVEVLDAMPGELSGGQKQRVAFARAFAGAPDLVIADEPTSALDMSVKSAILNLLVSLQVQREIALIFISHDLGAVRFVADRVLVLLKGEVVEVGTTQDVFAPPYHPYTEQLLAAVPQADITIRTSPVPEITKEDRDITDQGCPFSSRCPRKLPGRICDDIAPPLVEMANGHLIRCHITSAELRRLAPVLYR